MTTLIIILVFVVLLVLFPEMVLLILMIVWAVIYTICETILRIFGRSFRNINNEGEN